MNKEIKDQPTSESLPIGNANVMCRVGAKCQQNFGEEILRNCTVTDVTKDRFTVVADGLGWKMSNIPLDKFRPHGT